MNQWTRHEMSERLDRFRTIGDLLFVFNVEPLWQPLFQGIVLVAAVCLGSVRLLRIRNRLDLYG